MPRVGAQPLAQPAQPAGPAPHPGPPPRPAGQVLGAAAPAHQRAHAPPVLPPRQARSDRGQAGRRRPGGRQEDHSVHSAGGDRGLRRRRAARARLRGVPQDRAPGRETGGPRGEDHRKPLRDGGHARLAGGVQAAEGDIEAGVVRRGAVLLQAGDAGEQRSQPVQPPALPRPASRGAHARRRGDRRQRHRGLPRHGPARRRLRLPAQRQRGRRPARHRRLQARLQRRARHWCREAKVSFTTTYSLFPYFVTVPT